MSLYFKDTTTAKQKFINSQKKIFIKIFITDPFKIISWYIAGKSGFAHQLHVEIN